MTGLLGGVLSPIGWSVQVLPFQSPWRRELVLSIGDRTLYLNNAIGGGDPSATGLVIARRLGLGHVMAMHAPSHGPGHQSTQLVATGAHGEQRSLAAHCEDGRWSWHAAGDPLPFEDPARSRRRAIREWLDRPLLLDYLAALGIVLPPDDRLGAAVVVSQPSSAHPTRTLSLAQARAQLAISDER